MAKRRAPSRTKKVTKKASGRKATPRRPAPKKKARKAARPARAAKKAVPARRPKATLRKAQGRKPLVVKAARPKPAALERERRRLLDEDVEASVPSSFNFRPKASSAGSGGATARQHRRDHPQSGHDVTAGDLDTDWEEAYSGGDEAPGGDNPTPDQDVVEEIGLALGVEYDDAEELKGADKIIERDRHRWEYDPASSDDYRDRTKK